VINDEEAPNEGEKGLDNTEDTGRQETSARTSDTDRFEESGGVVVDGVDSERSNETRVEQVSDQEKRGDERVEKD
jgi:hypothetical protein